MGLSPSPQRFSNYFSKKGFNGLAAVFQYEKLARNALRVL